MIEREGRRNERERKRKRERERVCVCGSVCERKWVIFFVCAPSSHNLITHASAILCNAAQPIVLQRDVHPTAERLSGAVACIYIAQ